MEDNDAEHCDGMLVAGNEPGVVRQVLLARPNLSSPEDCNVLKLWEKLKIPDLTANELRSIATAKFVLTTHEVDVADQDLSRIEPTDEVKTLREAMDSPDWPIWEASIKKEPPRYLHGAPIVGTGKIEEPGRSKNAPHVIRLAR